MRYEVKNYEILSDNTEMKSKKSYNYDIKINNFDI